jgi:hypothetical protein
MDTVDSDYEAIEAHVYDHRQQLKGMHHYSMDKVDSDYEAIEEHANDLS